MAFPAKWPTFRKRYLDLDRHDNYQDALAEVSAGWTETKRLRALHDPPRTFNADWRQQAAAHMQTVKDNDIARRAALDAAEAARIAAVDAPGLAMLGAAADAIAADDATTDMLLGHDIDVGVMAAGPTPAEDANAFWRGGWRIGGRDPNRINIWLQINADGTISDRRVVKNTILSLWKWVDILRWSGPDLRDVQSRTNMDYVIQKRLCEIPNGGSNFVRARGYRNFPGDLAYRTIMDYCDGGDLDSLREAHSDQGIPEPVIWRIFEQLAKSAVVMEQGSLDAPVPGWQQIVHRDMKPANVFIEASTTPGVLYPDAKLSDFELAHETDPTDPFNPQALRAQEGGDLRWFTPEMRDAASRFMCSKVLNSDLPDLLGDQLLAATNIWGIGAIIFELMNGEIDFQCYSHVDPADPAVPGVNQVGQDEAAEGDIVMKNDDPCFDGWQDIVSTRYSNHLIDVVKGCLMDQPANRTTPTALLALINGPTPAAIDDDDDYRRDSMRMLDAKAARNGTNVSNEWPTFIDTGNFAYRFGATWADALAEQQQEEQQEEEGSHDGVDEDGEGLQDDMEQ